MKLSTKDVSFITKKAESIVDSVFTSTQLFTNFFKSAGITLLDSAEEASDKLKEKFKSSLLSNIMKDGEYNNTEEELVKSLERECQGQADRKVNNILRNGGLKAYKQFLYKPPEFENKAMIDFGKGVIKVARAIGKAAREVLNYVPDDDWNSMLESLKRNSSMKDFDEEADNEDSDKPKDESSN